MDGHSATQSSSRPAHTITVLAVLAFAALLVTGWLGVRQWNAPPRVSIPTPRMPSPNALDTYVQAANILTGQTGIDAGVNRPFTAKQRALVEANAHALKLTRQGFTLPYRCRPLRSINDTFPEYRQERELARLLTVEGQIKQEQGDWYGAVNSRLDAVRLGADVPHGGVILSDLVGIACQSIGRQRLWDVVDHLTAAQARQAAHRLEAIQTRQVPFVDVLQEEKWSGQSVMMNSFRNPKWQAIDFWHSKRMSMHNYTRYMDTAMKSARQPYALGNTEPPMPHDLMTAFLAPVVTPARLRHTDNEGQNALLITALALHAYHLEHGAYPTALSELVPAYLARVPDDPFALSGPVRYRRNGAAFVLYSVGPDGKDDGGTPIRDTSKTGRSRYFVWLDSQGDIVAGQNL